MASQPQAAAGGRSRLVLGLVVLVVVALAALVALQLTVGGVPVLERVMPATRPVLTLVRGAPPALECGSAQASGVVVAGAPVQTDLASAAAGERDASPVGEALVTATGYQRGAKRVDVVWVDGLSRARLVLTYAGAQGGWVLTGRSTCTG